MPERYIAFDVETPNAANDRMSAIGVAVVEGGAVVEEFSTLVNPETYFNAFNVHLTGITPGMAAEAPTFPELWPILAPILESGLLTAHNAPFDMSVLSKCLRAYGIPWRPLWTTPAPAAWGGGASRSWKTTGWTPCVHTWISPWTTTGRGATAGPAAELLLRCLDHGADIERFRRHYDLLRARTIS